MIGNAIHFSGRLTPRARYWLSAGAAAVVAFIVYLILVLPAAKRLAPDAIDEEAWSHSWYYSDPWRVIETQTTDRQLRNNVHPFYGIVTNPPTRALMALTGLDAHTAAMLLQHAIVFAMLLALATLLTRLNHNPLDVVLGALLVATSASLLFFTSVVETFAWGALSIFLALHILHRNEEDQPPSVFAFVAAGMISLGMTITNWMSALIGLWWESWTKRTLVLGLTLAGAVIVILLQRLAFEDAPTPSIWLINETRYITIPGLDLLLNKLATILLYSQISPAPVVSPPLDAIWSPPVLNMLQPLWGVKISLLGWLGWIAWAGLLLLAVFKFWSAPSRARTVTVVLLFVLFQCALHLLYGESPFLYALHFTPFLAVFALEAMRGISTRAAWIARGLAATAIIAAVPSNLSAFDSSLHHVAELTPEAVRIRQEILRRPADFTAARSGRVFIGALNAPIEEKGIVSPGGTFSPAPGSFGLSIVDVTDASPSSESLAAIGAGVGYRAASTQGNVEIEPLTGGAWRYRFQPSEASERFVVRLRGIGPAGGPLREISRLSDRGYLLNQTWRLTFAAPAGPLMARDEKIGTPSSRVDAFTSHDGWIEALITIGPHALDLQIEPVRAATREPLGMALAPLPSAALDDDVFRASLNTQVLTLAASVSANQTRPYDPLYADGPWPQDSAYTSVALAAAGQSDLAKAIVRAALANDYYGDYGSEAHATGLSLWALDQVARRTDDRGLLDEAWVHVLRKVDLMDRCTDPNAKGLFSLTSGPTIYPRHRFVCGPPFKGLVTGEIGLQVALSHATAFTQAGYAAAARIARALGHEDQATLWNEYAEKMETAWNSALGARSNNREVLSWGARAIDWLGDDLMLNMRVLAQSRGQTVGCFTCSYYFDQSALWPTWVGARSRATLATTFAEKHAADWGTPPVQRHAEPAVAVALAHQLLYAGNTRAARERLDWFLSHTQSPQLAQWGSSAYNETPRGAWAHLRAMPSAEHIIEPHYMTAAEVLLLQLDMLAYVRPGNKPTLVIASGSAPSWRSSPSKVGPIYTELGPVCWQWDGQALLAAAPDSVRIESSGVFSDIIPERAPINCKRRDSPGDLVQ